MNSLPEAYMISSKINLNQIISLVTEIEAEAYASPVYCQTLATLKENYHNEINTDYMLKKITRAVIRIAVKRFLSIPELQQKILTLKSFPGSNSSPPTPEPVQINPQNYFSAKKTSTCEDIIEDHIAPNSSPILPKNYPHKSVPNLANNKLIKKIYFWMNQAQTNFPQLEYKSNDFSKHQRKEQEKRLQEIGQQIQAARLAKSITISQLNLRTAILSSKIEAIENGCLDKLPEPIYVQGYIRRLGNAVGLDGDRLANYFLNHPNHTTKAIKTNEDKKLGKANHPNIKIYLSEIHLFWLYISLIASALGWLNFLMNQTNLTPENIKENNQNMKCLPVSPETETTPRQHKQELSPKENNLTANLSIAPPEIFG